MAYTPGFKNDVFVSYSHLDNRLGWVTEFDRRLQICLSELLGSPDVSVWRDRKLGGLDLMDLEIITQLSSSATLVCIVSPSAVTSGWCQREWSRFEEFAQTRGGFQIGTRIRAAKVVKTPLQGDAHRPLFGTLGHEFYTMEGRYPREFQPGDPDFNRKLDEVAWDLKWVLEELRKTYIPPLPPAPQEEVRSRTSEELPVRPAGLPGPESVPREPRQADLTVSTVPFRGRRSAFRELTPWLKAFVLILVCAAGIYAVYHFSHTPVQQGGRRTDKAGLSYSWILHGRFEMGCSDQLSGCPLDELPPHLVTVTKGFWIGTTEVTVAAYRKYAEARSAPMPTGLEGDDHPVARVTWDDASSFCQWVGGRLPTEAEWEFAARGGVIGARPGPLDRIAWFSGNSTGTQKVASKQRNPFDLYDMLGNVAEWTADWLGEYGWNSATDPRGPAAGAFRVVRGGSYVDPPNSITVWTRRPMAPDATAADVGFRCVLEK